MCVGIELEEPRGKELRRARNAPLQEQAFSATHWDSTNLSLSRLSVFLLPHPDELHFNFCELFFQAPYQTIHSEYSHEALNHAIPPPIFI